MLAPNWALGSVGVTYQGRLIGPDGNPVRATAVKFRIQIRTPGSEDCLLYEELQTLNLDDSNGMFAVSLGDGTGLRQDAYSGQWNLAQSFSNRKGFNFDSVDCMSGDTYVPNASDNRKLRVLFNDGSFAGWEAFPIKALNFVPMSIQTLSVGGFSANSLLRVETAGVLGNVSPLNNTQYNALVDLVNGNSNLYTKAGQLNGVALPSLNDGETVRWNSGAWQTFTPLTSESDPNVSAFAKAALPTCDPGEVLKADGTSLSCVTDQTGGGGGGGTVDTITGTSPISVDSTDAANPVVSLSLAESDIPTLSSPGKVSGSAITSGTIDGTTAIDIAGNIQTDGTITSIGNITVSGASGKVSSTYSESRRILLMDDDVGPTPHRVEIRTPSNIAGDYTMTLPGTQGGNNQVLGMASSGGTMEYKSITAGSGIQVNHTAGDIEIVATGGGGSVSGVTGTAPISVDNTDSANPIVSLNNVGTAGTYGSATEVPVFTTDASGRITGVTETTIAGVSPVGSALITGQVWVGDTNVAQARFIGLGDIKTNLGVSQFPTGCSESQTMKWSALTDVLTCEEIAIDHTQVAGLEAANISSVAGGNITSTNVQDAIDELDTDKVAKAGDTMTGSLGIGNAPHASAILDLASTTKGVLIPRMTEGQRDAISSPAVGLQVYNIDFNKVNYWDGDSWEEFGVAGAGVTSLNGLSVSSQGFATGDSSLTPEFSSSGSTHTLNIPMAHTASVTAGLISRSEFDTFSGKQDALGFTPLDPANNLSELTATASTARTNLGLGTAATKAYGSSAGNLVELDGGGKIPSSLLPSMDAGDIANAPTGNITSTNVQDAIDELDLDKVAKAGDTMTGTLNLPVDGLVVGTNQLVVDDGKVGVGTSVSNELFTVEGVVSLRETSAPTQTSDYGKIYVKSSDSKLYFMNDSGGEIELGASGGGGAVVGVSGTDPISVNNTDPASPVIGINTGNGLELSGSNLVVKAGTGVTVGAGGVSVSYGTSAGTAAQGNDSRLSDSRAPTGTASGDLDGTYPGPSVVKVQGRAVSNATPLADQVLVYKTGTSSWVPTHFGVDDLRTSSGGAQFASANCTSGQTLNWSSLSDAFTCVSIVIGSSNITDGSIVAADISSTVTDGFWTVSGANVYRLSGNVGIGTNNPTQALQVNGTIRATDLILTSDRRAKRNIQSLDPQWTRITKLNPVSYTWRENGKKDMGVIAQELKEVYPELVEQNSDGMFSVKYTGLIAPIISTIQELYQKFLDQSRKIEDLEKRLQALEAKQGNEKR